MKFFTCDKCATKGHMTVNVLTSDSRLGFRYVCMDCLNATIAPHVFMTADADDDYWQNILNGLRDF